MKNEISEQTWAEIKLGFMAGKSVADLAKQYDVKASTIYKRITRQQWAHEREKIKHEIDEMTNESFDLKKKQFKHKVAASYDPWLEDAERIRKLIPAGDVEAFNKAVNAVTKIHASGQKHFNISDSGEVAVVLSGVLVGTSEEDKEDE